MKTFVKVFNSKLLPSFIISIIMLATVTASVYAWFVYAYSVSDTDFSTGKLQPRLSLYCWDTTGAGSWTALATDGSVGSLCAYSGYLDNLASLPADFIFYLKIKVDENSGASYNYNIYVADIKINVYSGGVMLEESVIPHVGYFNETLSQRCFDYSVAVNTNNLLPSAITFGENVRLVNPGQSLTDNVFTASNCWLYVKVVPRLTDFQNILRSIPASYMPYRLEFIISIDGESRTTK